MKTRQTLGNFMLVGLMLSACSGAPETAFEDDEELREALRGEPDWAMVGRTARRTSNNPLETTIGTANVASLVETWSAVELGSFAPSLAVWGSRLFISNLVVAHPEWGTASVLEALDPVAGTKLWQAPLAEDQGGTFSPEGFTSPMAVAYGRIHIQHVNFSPLLSTKTGRLLGRSALKTGMDDRISAPLLKGQALVVETSGEYFPEAGDYRRTVFAADATTNTRLWRRPLGAPFEGPPRNPALGSDVVFTVDGDSNSIVALRVTDGSTLWTGAAASGDLGSPSVVNGRVYAVSRPNTLRAYDALTGEQLWASVHTGGAVTGAPERAPVLGNDSAYIALDKAGGGVAVGAFVSSDGKRRWSKLLDVSTGQSSAVALANGVLYVGTSSGQLFAMSAASGAILATFVLASGIHGIVVADGRLHVAAFNHGVHTFEPASF